MYLGKSEFPLQRDCMDQRHQILPTFFSAQVLATMSNGPETSGYQNNHKKYENTPMVSTLTSFHLVYDYLYWNNGH